MPFELRQQDLLSLVQSDFGRLSHCSAGIAPVKNGPPGKAFRGGPAAARLLSAQENILRGNTAHAAFRLKAQQLYRCFGTLFTGIPT